ncbi:bifunctional PIG-L family deacetylase/class I SAM-dependent methyltransferase [Brevibacterium luteolum]|uniref:bifunctional PIG-L family deacetylase/class I SAM-dependent methyltransferase n=1 Tax=Brevibacterium luteolum TaxID=199591 RepID=UPI00223BA102|nr:bifunctional PIG-L family deacetylase/class I SAM-dependent methyltransferase [Brevibacterium luteolum]MCT1873801.1 PIG-L family deacetylase [Brevibacterium luteolum]MCT1889483.1 PIG-L family deacetylase [Brevibacterium luteolum]MCT1893544.1 PIG-L family deacetylase [Brevibacterium luteolum]MCT1924385.1 PIG-L family deacetylase [Brevibacterium luteolum]
MTEPTPATGPAADAESAGERTFSGAQVPAASGTDLDTCAAALPAWPGPAALPGLLIVAPHPDDEIAGAGGLFAAALDAGIPVRLAAVTDGEGSHPPEAIDPAELAAIRRGETDAALQVLADAAGHPVPPVTRLSIPDGAVAEHEEVLAGRLAELLDELPTGTWIAAPLRTDGHPDHDAAGRAAFAAAATRPTCPVVEYPVWLWQHTAPADVPDELAAAAVRLDVPERLRASLPAALDCFRSQVSLDYGVAVDRDPAAGPEAVVLPAGVRERMCRERQVVFVHRSAGFDDLYRHADDPWSVGQRWYERRRAGLIMAMLPKPRFGRVFEPGCSIGMLSEQLAGRCEELICADVVPAAVHAARQRLRASGAGASVEVRCAGIEDWPAGSFDLIVFSELAYYLSDASFHGFLASAAASLRPGGVVLAAHWRHPVPGGYRSAESAHAALAGIDGWTRHASYRDADVLIDVIGPDAPSVASQEFLG